MNRLRCFLGFHDWIRTGEARTVGLATRLRWGCGRYCGTPPRWADEGERPSRA